VIYIHIHINVILFTFTKKEVFLYATAWVLLEDIVLDEISQSQKDKYPHDGLMQSI
jgi:hypothetical protein